MFEKCLKNKNLADLLLPIDRFNPYPKGTDRKFWSNLPDHFKTALIKDAEYYLDFDWPQLLAVRFMDFTSNGNRSNYEKVYQLRRSVLCKLVIAECIEYNKRFLGDIINGIWCICEESVWTLPAHSYLTKRCKEPLPDISEQVIDLLSGETGSLLALTSYLLKESLDSISLVICQRIGMEVKRRILLPYMERDDFWWMGLNTTRRPNNWNPWCNSNCLVAFLFLEENYANRVLTVEKILKSLDRFIDIFQPDGGCDEGPAYWNRAGGSLFDCLELIFHATGGNLSFYDNPLIGEIGKYIYRFHIDRDYFINFADCSARVNVPGDLIYRYGKRINDEKLKDLGGYLENLEAIGTRFFRWESMLRILPAITNFKEIEEKVAKPHYTRDCCLPNLQVMAAREKNGTNEGFYLAVKGGCNAESHNHNDVGQFILYYNGFPVIIDVGVETYTAKTFSDQRYEIWTMQSDYHNLPSVNNVMQKDGTKYKAANLLYENSDECVSIELDIAAAYPEVSSIKSWVRTLKLFRRDNPMVTLVECFQLEEGKTEVVINMMLANKPFINTQGKIVLNTGTSTCLVLLYEETKLAVECHRIPVVDEKLAAVWGKAVYRLIFKAVSNIKNDTFSFEIKLA